MRNIFFGLLLISLLAGLGCKRRADSPPPPTTRADRQPELPTEQSPSPAPEPAASVERVDAVEPGPVETDDAAAAHADAAPPPAPDFDPELALSDEPLELPLPTDSDSPLELDIEPSPMDELAEIELYSLEVDADLEESVSADLRELSFDIPVVLNRPVLQFLNYYQGRGRKIMELGLQRSGRYLDFFRQIFEAEQVPRDLTYLPHVESLFKPRAYSRAHARGLWQFVLGTGRKYGLESDWWVDERSNVEKSTVAAARHLRDLHQEFGDWYLALAAYNSGPGRVRRVLARHGALDYWEMCQRRLLPRETRNYVPSFLASLIIFKHPEKYGFLVEPEAPVQWEEVPLDYQLDLRVAADLLEMKSEELLDLNPQLRRGVTPYGRPGFALKVPPGTGDMLAKSLAKLPEEKRLKVQHYRVRKGDTLSVIARKHGSSIRAIADMNRIRNIHRLRLGQDLLIPSAGWRSSPSAPSSPSRPASYVVRKGDSLYKIARRHGLTVAQLAAWNNLSPGQTIFPGQRLRLLRDSASASSQ